MSNSQVPNSLIPGGEYRPELAAVEIIPATFWDDLIWHSGVAGVTSIAWPAGLFSVHGETWCEVEIKSTVARAPQGRKSLYDWPQFDKEALRCLEKEGGFTCDWRQADLERHMTAWCEANWDRAPAESKVREAIKRVEREYVTHKRKGP